MSTYILRPAKEDDCDQIMKLIMELAEYEKMPEKVQISAEVLRRDGFGEDRYFHCVVAEQLITVTGNESEHPLVGYAMYYFSFCPWFGKTCVMEDIYVVPQWRSKGIGSDLWASVARVALTKDCGFLQWVVLDWNKLAIDFYQNHGARNLTQQEGWQLFRLEKNAMKEFVAKKWPKLEALSTS